MGEKNEIFFIKVWKPLLNKRVLKTVRVISVRSGLELLQIVSESDIGRCASKEAVPEGGRHGVVPQRGRHEVVCQ